MPPLQPAAAAQAKTHLFIAADANSAALAIQPDSALATRLAVVGG
jgi:hypothetical protein